MTNLINIRTENTTAIKVTGNSEMSNGIKGVATRFFLCASVLPEDGYIGWEINSQNHCGSTGTVFASPSIEVIDTDYEWIFGECGEIDHSVHAKLSDLWADDRKVYVLVMKDKSFDNIYRCVDRDMEGFYDLYNMFMEEDAVIRIIAGKDEKGILLISLKNKMSLKMRSMIKMFIYGVASVEIAKCDQENKEILVPDSFLGFIMAQFILTIIDRMAKDKLKSSDKGDETIEIEMEETPIRDLNLSVRAYNCLVRAGITTVEKLAYMTDEELKAVRNLGANQIREIKERLKGL